MFIIYLAIGLCLALFLHTAVKWVQNNGGLSSARVRQIFKAGGVIGLLAIISRLSLTRLNLLLGLLPFLLPLLRRSQNTDVSSARNQTMTKAEARRILGVSESASAEDIREAHRRLITRNHPDQGGSDYLASQINLARDILLES